MNTPDKRFNALLYSNTFSRALSTGHLSAGLLTSKHGAPSRSRVGAWLNLEKIARKRKKSFKKTIDKISDGIEYRPPKKKIFRLSIKALVKPRTFIKTLPKPIMREGMRVIKKKRI